MTESWFGYHSLFGYFVCCHLLPSCAEIKNYNLTNLLHFKHINTGGGLIIYVHTTIWSTIKQHDTICKWVYICLRYFYTYFKSNCIQLQSQQTGEQLLVGISSDLLEAGLNWWILVMSMFVLPFGTCLGNEYKK